MNAEPSELGADGSCPGSAASMVANLTCRWAGLDLRTGSVPNGVLIVQPGARVSLWGMRQPLEWAPSRLGGGSAAPFPGSVIFSRQTGSRTPAGLRSNALPASDGDLVTREVPSDRPSSAEESRRKRAESTPARRPATPPRQPPVSPAGNLRPAVKVRTSRMTRLASLVDQLLDFYKGSDARDITSWIVPARIQHRVVGVGKWSAQQSVPIDVPEIDGAARDGGRERPSVGAERQDRGAADAASVTRSRSRVTDVT
jgi:hypothetical protein